MSGLENVCTFSVAVVDDQLLFRDGAVAALGEELFSVVGTGSNGNDALSLALRYAPQLLLMEFNIPHGGIPLIKRLSEEHPAVKLVVLTASNNDEDVTKSFEAGARGYLLKTITSGDLQLALQKISEGNSYVMPELGAKLIAGRSSRRKEGTVSDALSHLTAREMNILDRVAAGQRNKEIARDLNLNEKTVKHYMTVIMQKLHVSNRVQAALIRLQQSFE